MQKDDVIYRQAAISEIMEDLKDRSLHDDPATPEDFAEGYDEGIRNAAAIVLQVPPAQPDESKYEYHYDHTDCIWYRPEARNRCPTTCAQYRDGWNDAMNYIFRDGAGYRPYRRDQKYE